MSVSLVGLTVSTPSSSSPVTTKYTLVSNAGLDITNGQYPQVNLTYATNNGIGKMIFVLYWLTHGQTDDMTLTQTSVTSGSVLTAASASNGQSECIFIGSNQLNTISPTFPAITGTTRLCNPNMFVRQFFNTVGTNNYDLNLLLYTGAQSSTIQYSIDLTAEIFHQGFNLFCPVASVLTNYFNPGNYFSTINSNSELAVASDLVKVNSGAVVTSASGAQCVTIVDPVTVANKTLVTNTGELLGNSDIQKVGGVAVNVASSGGLGVCIVDPTTSGQRALVSAAGELSCNDDIRNIGGNNVITTASGAMCVSVVDKTTATNVAAVSNTGVLSTTGGGGGGNVNLTQIGGLPVNVTSRGSLVVVPTTT